MSETDPLVADFARRHPDAFSRSLQGGSDDDVVRVVEALPPETRASIVARLPAASVIALTDRVPDFAANWLSPAPIDHAIELLARLPRTRRLELVNSLPDAEQRRRLLRHQAYPKHAIGSLVVDVPLRVAETASVTDVVTAMRGLGESDPGQLIVVDESGAYVGVIDPWRLITARTAGSVRRHISFVEPLRPEMLVDDIASDERWFANPWLPVVDQRNRVMGRVSRARVLRAAREQADLSAGRAHIMGSLFAELVYLLGDVLARSLNRHSSR